METNKSVAILMCTYNGEKFIEEQIKSIFTQTYKNWVLYVSDDGSTDGTISKIKALAREYGYDNIIFLHGPKAGFAKNFISLLSINKHYDYYAFCDQDDIWHKDKLKAGIELINRKESNEPVLYCGRTRLIDQFGNVIGYSPLFRKRPGFRNSLVQSLAGGNTMIFNSELHSILRNLNVASNFISHDWTVYQLASACGSHIIYDSKAYIDYRQHENNLIGANANISAKIVRLRMLMHNEFKFYNDVNEHNLQKLTDLFTKENCRIFNLFILMRKSNFLMRVRLFFKLRIYRQTFWGNCGLILAILSNKI